MTVINSSVLPEGTEQSLMLEQLGPPQPPEWLPPPFPSARRRRPALRLLLTLLLAAICGAGSGWAAATLADHNDQATMSNTKFSGEGLDVASVLSRVGPSVVNIETTITTQIGPRQVTGQAAGTGIILTADGKVLTNAHVIADSTTITVTLPGTSTSHPATVLSSNADADVAIIQINGVNGLSPAPFGDSSSLRVGDDVVTIGNALALVGGPTVTKGIVSALDRSITTDTSTLQGLIQTDAGISSGDSGGPLVNAAGQIVGLDTAGASSSQVTIAQNVAFAIPINTALAIVHAAGIATS